MRIIERFDAYSVLNAIYDGISSEVSVSKEGFIQELFDTFEPQLNQSVDLTSSSLVGRWFNGMAAVSPQIVSFYANNNCNSLSEDIQYNIFPILADHAAVIEAVSHLLLRDTSISERKKQELMQHNSCETVEDEAYFLAKLLIFAMQRPFVKRIISKKQLKCQASLSPVLREFVLGGETPAPCKWFCGREKEMERIAQLLEENSKVFVTGIPGIGKSELVKAFVKQHRSDYINIFYLPCDGGGLTEAITNLDTADDRPDEEQSKRFKRHHRLLKTLKEDSLLIFDNFNQLDDGFLSDALEYRCRIVFTTRNRYPEQTELEVEEIAEEETLFQLFKTFYADVEDCREIILNIIRAVHSHTFLVELVARLLNHGMMSPEVLLKHLDEEQAGMSAEDIIIATKDKKRRRYVYREHIRRLFELYALMEEEQEFLRCLTLAPTTGINERIFSLWLGRNNLNSANLLVEMGLLQRQDVHRILFHPLILEVVLADLRPSVDNCHALLSQINYIMLHHGIDLNHLPLMCAVLERTVAVAVKDNTQAYLRLLQDSFVQLEDYHQPATQRILYNELYELVNLPEVNTPQNQAYLLECQAILSKNANRAVRLRKEALENLPVTDEVAAQLASNIHFNLANQYITDGKIGLATREIEESIQILQKYGLVDSHDSATQFMTYGIVCVMNGEIEKGIDILERLCVCYYYSYLEMTSDCARIHLYCGMAYAQKKDFKSAMRHFQQAENIYRQIFANQPELLREKLI